jgi:hypothetical protein
MLLRHVRIGFANTTWGAWPQHSSHVDEFLQRIQKNPDGSIHRLGLLRHREMTRLL